METVGRGRSKKAAKAVSTITLLLVFNYDMQGPDLLQASFAFGKLGENITAIAVNFTEFPLLYHLGRRVEDGNGLLDAWLNGTLKDCVPNLFSRNDSVNQRLGSELTIETHRQQRQLPSRAN